MPRQRHQRKMLEPPHFEGYKPYGTSMEGQPSVELLYEEYETLKWADYYGMNHNQACRHMGISRSTFARIYENARRKIARALVETREIATSPGDVVFEDDWYLCQDCHTRFPLRHTRRKEHCPSCQSDDLESITK